ncbi:MAG: Acetaldehyde dehydrogenase (acetylating) [Clostridia bacterium]|jgi:propionaldehyde dehydrogenase|nr:Acetaldehyde dehydrogenase (acetylating) [Clostridia bacterium]
MIDEKQINLIVEKVLKNIAAGNIRETENKKLLGVFESMEDALEAAEKAYNSLREYSIEQREQMISAIRKLTLENAEIMAKMGVEETGMGRVDHKILKHQLVANKTPGTEDLNTTAWSGDRGLTLVERAPYGVIGAITPSTNPSETVICNSIGMIAAGNAVVFNPHPNAVNVSNFAVDLVNKAVMYAGGPKNLVCSVYKPTLQSADIMMKHPAVKLLVATGGPGVVRALLSSGKKAIGAGAGNPPVIVDDTADIKKAAKDIIDGATFDNNLPCIAEKEVFALENIADELVYYMQQNGAYLIKGEEIEQLVKIVLTEKEELQGKGCTDRPKRELMINKKWVGKDAKLILRELGIYVEDDIRCIICETGADHPFVVEELMMPILPIVRVNNVDEAIRLAVKAEHGNRHTAHMHSKNIDNLTKFAKAIGTTIFVKNAPSYAGIGVGSEGYATFTIAGPTGEGLTSTKTFTRERRCVLVDSLSII